MLFVVAQVRVLLSSLKKRRHHAPCGERCPRLGLIATFYLSKDTALPWCLQYASPSKLGSGFIVAT
uniref:Uncharacterized protein n=1 Tax=mine drainage metagenome TaxID=410659 RepID=E6QW57_9ZZZZ